MAARGAFPPEPLEPAQALAIIKHIKPRTRKGCRDRAILAVMWRCGLRCAEVRDLAFSNLKINEPRSLTVLRPKGTARGKKPRTVGLDETTLELIRQWLRWRGAEPGPLFTSTAGTPLQLNNMRRMVAGRGREAGIARRVHPHCFRHTYARDLYLEGVGMVDIMNSLGHSGLETTARYLQSIGCTQSVAITSERQWEV